MSEIVLTEEQSRQIASAADDLIAVRKADGEFVGYVAPAIDRAEFERLEREAESDGPFLTTAEVIDRLKSLERS